MAKRGPKARGYQTSDGRLIPGLWRDYDGRWRIVASGKRFSEPDEKKAIARYERETASEEPIQFIKHQEIQNAHLLQWVAEQIRTRPKWVAEQMGIEEIGYLKNLKPPAPSIKLAALSALYRDKSDAKSQAKAETISSFEQMVERTGARTLEDLTTAKLIAYRDWVKASGKKAGTVGAYFSRCKWVIKFGLQHGLDANQIKDALLRMAVLVPPKDNGKHNPQPISRDDYAKLVAAAADSAHWKAVLYVALNLCLYLDETLGLEWSDFDLDKGTYVGERGKTKVVKVAVLWRETIDALKALPRKGPYVFTSKHGTRFNTKGQWKVWVKLNEKAQTDCTFNQIRDGAYTAACEGTDDERKARLLAGHAAQGLTDNYVRRNPQFVATACEAVYAAYFVATKD